MASNEKIGRKCSWFQLKLISPRRQAPFSHIFLSIDQLFKLWSMVFLIDFLKYEQLNTLSCDSKNRDIAAKIIKKKSLTDGRPLQN